MILPLERGEGGVAGGQLTGRFVRAIVLASCLQSCIQHRQDCRQTRDTGIVSICARHTFVRGLRWREL
jgi:hypothetical protein